MEKHFNSDLDGFMQYSCWFAKFGPISDYP